MPQEEIFLEVKAGAGTIRVIKTYDAAFAKECYEHMDDQGLKALADSLRLQDNYDEVDIPAASDVDYRDFLWQEVFDCAREDGQIRSFFVVTRTDESRAEALYVSGDWPSAETYAKRPEQAIAQ